LTAGKVSSADIALAALFWSYLGSNIKTLAALDSFFGNALANEF